MGFVDIGHSKLDVSRAERTGIEEVVFAAGKSKDHLLDVVGTLLDRNGQVLITKLSAEQGAQLKENYPRICINPDAQLAWIKKEESSSNKLGHVAVVSAGTSDFGVAEEAAGTAEYFDLAVERVFDVGVADLSRVLSFREKLASQDVLIVVAGMEGALASVVAGIVPSPIIAVPTSVGYGASFQGLAAVLGMLVSCSPGVSVVNIDNGFGAAVAAYKAIKQIRK